MDDEIHLEISIPADDDGYVLLKCEHCGNYFKTTPSDIEDDGILEIFCPSCGLVSESYVTEDVLELAQTMIENVAMDMIYDTFKQMEQKFKNGPITFNAGKRSRHKTETPIHSGIDSLEVATFPCCKRKAKVKPLLKMTGCYCPFCGVKNYEVE